MKNSLARWPLFAAALITLWSAAAATAQPAAACPPVAQMPSPGQLQAAQQNARDRGFLWRIDRDGRSSYLYGTMHLGKLDWAIPGPQVRGALGAVDTLALELDLLDPALLQQFAASLAGKPDAVVLPAALQARLARQTAAACLPPAALDGQHPVMRAITLAMLAARWDGLDPSYAQELVLGGFARAAKLAVVALETVDQQMTALIPAEPAKALLMIGQALDQLEAGTTRRATARLAKAWAESRIDDLAQYEIWCDCVASDDDRAFLKRLNDDRNPALARRIEAVHASGKRVFAAVGALHMTGAMALPKLMAERGFKVERIEFAR